MVYVTAILGVCSAVLAYTSLDLLVVVSCFRLPTLVALIQKVLHILVLARPKHVAPPDGTDVHDGDEQPHHDEDRRDNGHEGVADDGRVNGVADLGHTEG